MRTLTRNEYARAFEAWLSVVRLHADDVAALKNAIADFRAVADDGTARGVEDFCAEAWALLGDDHDGLRITIEHSCLLYRMVYLGEPIRTEACPLHKGRWSGIRFTSPCPHGCDTACGCVTGWLPNAAWSEP